MVTAIQGLKLSGVGVVVVEDRSYGTVFISNHCLFRNVFGGCAFLCQGFPKDFSQFGLCTEEFVQNTRLTEQLPLGSWDVCSSVVEHLLNLFLLGLILSICKTKNKTLI